MKIKAFAYTRTSSATNLDGDSKPRQEAAIASYAKREGLEIVKTFSDDAVSGVDRIETRPGFSAMLAAIEGNGVRTIICEDTSRFAREITAQELGVLILRKRGVRLLTADDVDLTNTDDPMRKMIRVVAGAFVEFEKDRLVLKLKAARDRRRASTGRCEGRKPVAAKIVALAKKLARKRPKGGKRSLREIAAELAAAGHVAASGKPYGHQSVKLMLARE